MPRAASRSSSSRRVSGSSYVDRPPRRPDRAAALPGHDLEGQHRALHRQVLLGRAPARRRTSASRSPGSASRSAATSRSTFTVNPSGVHGALTSPRARHRRHRARSSSAATGTTSTGRSSRACSSARRRAGRDRDRRRRRGRRARRGAPARARARPLVTSGGLGPTHDDRTVELLARAAGLPLRVDAELEAAIESRLAGGRRADEAAVRRLRRGRAQAGDAPRGRGRGRRRRHGAGARPRGRRVRRGGAARARRGSCSRSGPSALETEPLRALLARAPAAGAPGAAVLRRRPSRRSPRRSPRPAATGTASRSTICARDSEIHVDLFVEPGARGARRRRSRARSSSRSRSALFATRRRRRSRSSCSTSAASAG